MASSYALPASAIHTHHAHVHPHSHSHSHSQSQSTSPGRPFAGNTSRPLRSERSNGSLHSHSASESSINHGHQSYTSHNYSRLSPIPSPSIGDGFTPIHSTFEDWKNDNRQPLTRYPSYDSVNKVVPPDTPSYQAFQHEHDHDHGHDHHSHDHAISTDPRSKFTSLLLPMMQKYPLLHTIMAEKDSRRIFYFMR